MKAIRCAGASGQDWLVVQMPLDICSQHICRLVTTTSIFLQRLHHDPVEVAADSFGQHIRGSASVFSDVGQCLTESAKFCGRLPPLVGPPATLSSSGIC